MINCLKLIPMKNKCINCGKQIDRSYQGFCQSCYHYFKIQNKKLYYTYKGPLQYNEEGDAICPDCGMAYRKLGGHIRYAHNMTADKFYKLHGWVSRKVKASNKAYRLHMKNIQKDYCKDNLKKGVATRFNGINANPMAVNTNVVKKYCINCECCQIEKHIYYCHNYNNECKYALLKCKRKEGIK